MTEVPLDERDVVWVGGRFLHSAIVLVVTTVALVESLTFPQLAMYLPLLACVLILLGTSVQALIDTRNLVTGRPVLVRGLDLDAPPESMGWSGLRLAARYIAWLLGFLVLLYLLGGLIGGAAFVVLFLKFVAGWRWRGLVVAAAVVIAVSYLLFTTVGLHAPRSLLELGYGLL